ncbi:relaxase MobL [Streptomyces sp. NBC_00439]|uniref:relaxase MobL n=1 Tax=Streptomyces sp. NBC_00439 TaxID=2903650 RepID=UPI0022583E20|nr:relaxase MobL [Streptomyces sp. NBC_00439]MCX5103422.1 relaxase MobL [Streptomyces sp. NBC_00439]
MGLKQDIIVVNEFSVPLPGGKGSRGATPGQYVERYMAREQATEPLAPIQRLRTDDFVMRYMARESAVERAGISRDVVKTEMRQAQGIGGVAFGYGSVSLSDEQLKAASKDLQRHFENGKTVLKTVLSFDEAYLKKHGIVDQDFRCETRGDYRGHIDQMKLRMAIMHGLERMSAGTSGFDDLRYVGVIQVDTEHVHCHLAMVDGGPGQVTKNGTQRGKLLDRHKTRLRRGVDAWLDEKQAVAHLSSAVGYERRNVTTFIKRWAHERIRAESLPQFLLACLPANRQLWRAGSNDARMRKANRLVTELVTQQLERAGSPMPEAMEKCVGYANERRARESLSTGEWQKLVERGRAQIMERAVNGVYQMLRAMPESELRVHTPMLEVMGLDYQQMAVLAADRQGTDENTEADLVSFGFRLRSYTSRLQHHGEKAGAYRDLARQWEQAEKAGVAAEDSRPLYDFYRFEEDYHRRLMSKYRRFLPFLGDVGQWYEQQREVAAYGQRLLSLMALRADTSLQRMNDADEAERLGRTIYDQPGGRLLTQGRSGRAVLDARIRTMKRFYGEKLDGLRADLASSGLVLRVGPSPEDEASAAGTDTVSTDFEIVASTVYDFGEVKALDLHHLGYDFVTDVEISPQASRIFVETTEERRRLLLAAMDYLDQSGQSEAIPGLPVDDLAAMARVSRELTTSQKNEGPRPLVLRSRIAELRTEHRHAERMRRSKASSLDAGLVVRVQAEVDQAVTRADTTTAFDSQSPSISTGMEHEWNR